MRAALSAEAGRKPLASGVAGRRGERPQWQVLVLLAGRLAPL